MTPRGRIRDVPASIRQRLLNLAREQGIRFNSVLQRYAAERFLYRLSVSGEVNRFTLKGAALFRIWTRQEMRPTRDVDFLSVGPEDHAAIRATLATVCGSPCPEDGVVFDPETMRIANIRDEQPHGGVRARINGRLGPRGSWSRPGSPSPRASRRPPSRASRSRGAGRAGRGGWGSRALRAPA